MHKMSCHYRYASASNCVVNSMIRPLSACHAIVISRVFWSYHTHECAPRAMKQLTPQ